MLGARARAGHDWDRRAIIRRFHRRGSTMHPERKIVTSGPENSETPLESIASWVTPNRLFFVRNHFEVPPDASPQSWELILEGLVARPMRWTFAQLAAMP